MISRSVFMVSAAALVLAGCVDRGGWKAVPKVEPNSLTAQHTLEGTKLDVAAWPSDQWWRSYGDPQLDALVEEALAGSPSLEIAQARLRAAQAQAVRAGGARFPSAAVNGEVTRQRYPEHGLYPPPYAGSWSTDARAAVDFTWELDFWGKNRALLAQARSGVAAAQADQEAARLAISVAVVRAYIQLALNYALLDVTNDNLKQQNSILDLTKERVSAGLENNARVKQSEGTVALTRAGVVYVQASIDLTSNQLADLVGAGPDRGRALTRPKLTAPADIALPSTLPSDLLARRPDVAAARAQVEGAGHGIAAAEAEFYPDVNLVGFAGFQTIGLSQLFDYSDRIAGIGPTVRLPVFNRAALRGNLYAQQAALDAAVGQYNQTLLDAVREVADVVTNWQALEGETTQQVAALDAAQSSYDLTTQRYKAGLDNYLSVLSAQNEVLLAQGLGAELAARRLTFSADLARALGGGYGVPPPPSAPLASH